MSGGGNPFDLIAPDGTVDLYAANPRYFVKPNPQGDFSGLGRRRMRLFPGMSEETAFNLPGFLGIRGVLGTPHTAKAIGGMYAPDQDPREWLA